VSFEIEGPLGEVDACHCGQCRRWSGHVWASTDVKRSAVRIEGEEKVSWFRSSDKVRRGFCSVCGSALFWAPLGQDRIAIAMGALDAPTGARLAKHIFTASRGDYYEIADGLPQHRG
jgi:hypothetical protein